MNQLNLKTSNLSLLGKVLVGMTLIAIMSAALYKSPVVAQSNLRAQSHSIPRLLQEATVSSFLTPVARYLDWSMVFLLVAMVSNTFSIFLPLILFLESFYFIGFIGVQRGSLDTFFQAYLNGPLGYFSIVRELAGTPSQSSTAGLTDNLVQLGVQTNLYIDIMPCIGILGFLLTLTIVVFAINVLVKNQKLRSFMLVVKSIWNGTVYCLMPYICFGMGVSSYSLQFSNTNGIINVATFVVCALVLIVYPILLILQIKGYVSHPSDSESKKSLSMVEMLKLMPYKFDCISCSNKYFYAQAYLKTIIFFFGIGVTFSYANISLILCLLGEMIELVLFITNPPFLKRRHNIVGGMCFVIIMSHCFVLLLIDLTEDVELYDASGYLVSIFLISQVVGIVGLLVNAGMDVVIMFKKCFLAKRLKQSQAEGGNFYQEQQTDIKLQDNDLQHSRSKSNKQRQGVSPNSDMQSSKANFKGSKTKNYEDKENSNSLPKVRKVRRPREI